MNRLTTNKDISDIEGMYELAHNSCYIDKDGNTRYRDFETDVDARVLTRELLKKYADGDDAFIDDEDFDNQMMEALQYGTDTIEGVIALFYRNLWVMAELRERLKAYEDLQDMIGVPFEKFAELCKQEIPEECKNPSKAIILTDDDVDEWHQYKADKEQGLLLKLPFKIGDTVYVIAPNYIKCENQDDCDDFDSGNYLATWCIYHCRNGFKGYGVVECSVTRIERRRNDIYFQTDKCGMRNIENLFLTKEEAEQALAKMKEV